MDELRLSEDGRYVTGDVPFGYTLWGDRLVEVPEELDAWMTAIGLVKAGKGLRRNRRSGANARAPAIAR